jgi:hypothetical protein
MSDPPRDDSANQSKCFLVLSDLVNTEQTKCPGVVVEPIHHADDAIDGCNNKILLEL